MTRRFNNLPHPLPPMPSPNEADKAEAERMYDETPADRWHLIHDRADYVAKLARLVMQKRLHAEYRAQFQASEAA